MQKQRPSRPLDPNQFYRVHEGRAYFGYQPTQLNVRIAEGYIPAPAKLSPSGRACGWLGKTILDWQDWLQAVNDGSFRGNYLKWAERNKRKGRVTHG